MRDRLVTLFNDASPENSGSLQEEIATLEGIGTLKYKPRVMSEEVGSKIVEQLGQGNLVPTLFFVDPWGYKGLSLGLINSVLKNWGCDCVFFFNYNRINMGLNNEAVEEHMNVLFGETRADELRKRIIGMTPEEREAEIVETLAQALRDLGANFVLPFCFKDEWGRRTSHHLVFATKHPRGYRIMKEIMAKKSSENHQGVASFGYCPASSTQTLLFDLNRPLDDLKEMLLEAFAGQTVSVKEIYERHNVGKPYIMKNYKSVLLSMEETEAIRTNPRADKRPRGTFADRVQVSFPQHKGGEQ